MHALDFLVPDALLPSAESARELLRGLPLPHLDLIAAHAFEPDGEAKLARGGLLTPWQEWLLTRNANEKEPNLAEAWAFALGAIPTSTRKSRWMIEPVHLQVGLDSVTLFDPALLALTPQESAALAEAARPVLESDGWELDAASPQRWLVSRGDGFDLEGAAIERVIGEGIEQWLPHSAHEAHARAWRRTSNEIQMTWFTDPVNAAREAAGKAPVNGVWLSGNGRRTTPRFPYSKVTSTLPLLASGGKLVGKLDGNSGEEIETFDQLIGPARNHDGHAWRTAMQALDARLGAVVDALRKGRFEQLRMVLCGDDELREFQVRRRDLWKFWRRGNAADLLTDQQTGSLQLR